MDLQLEGKRALVSGSTAGIGYAIAEALAQEGAHVVVNGRTSARVDEALKKLHQGKVRGKVEGLAADLGTSAGCAAATQRFPELDILVNNLGIFEVKPFEEVLVGPTASEGAMRYVGEMAAKAQKSADQVEKEFFQTGRPTSLLRRFADPAEIGCVVAFVCSPLASTTTGAAIRAEGGVIRAIL